MKNLLLLLVTVLSLSFMSCEKDNIEPSTTNIVNSVELASNNIMLEIDSLIITDINGIKQNPPLKVSTYTCNDLKYYTTHFSISDIDISSGTEYIITVYFKEWYSYEQMTINVLLEGGDACERNMLQYNSSPIQINFKTYTQSIKIK